MVFKALGSCSLRMVMSGSSVLLRTHAGLRSPGSLASHSYHDCYVINILM